MILILNGSPKKKGKVATLLAAVEKGLKEKGHQVEWIDTYDLKIAPCIACMKCRPDGRCILPGDGAHIAGDKIAACEGLVVGTPTHWGNMSAQLKLLFDRTVPVFMGEKPNGFPIPRQKGKPALIVTACTTPWPFNFIAAESRGAIHAVREVLHYGGLKIKGKLALPGTKSMDAIPGRFLDRAYKMGLSL
ncbi:MAG: flavodoxin family protein [Desulfatibacillaceae bacterium]|nr:flavodoxin family protein [Desulfatibacillaceae bacterium]